MCETLELDKVNTVYQVDSYLAEATMKEVKLTPIEEKLNLLKPPKVESNYIKYLFQLQTKPNGGIYEFEIEVQKKLNSLDTQLEFPVIGMISRINKYGNDEHCIHEKFPELRKFCYCKEKFVENIIN